jgi:two-component system, NarL family, nitrate/nitrite response regulator NarL
MVLTCPCVQGRVEVLSTYVSRQSATPRKPSVYLLASHPLVLSEFNRLLSDGPFRVQPQKVQPTTANLESIVISRADVYVMDYNGGAVSAPMLLSAIMRQYPDARVLLVGDRFDDQTAFPLLGMGAKGLLEHAVLASQIESALKAVASGSYWVPRSVLSRFVDHVLKAHPGLPSPSATALSRREKEVAEALLENLSNKEIANRLNISERTVKFHVSNLLEKFGVGRRADLIVMRYQQASKVMPPIAPSNVGTPVN